MRQKKGEGSQCAQRAGRYPFTRGVVLDEAQEPDNRYCRSDLQDFSDFPRIANLMEFYASR